MIDKTLNIKRNKVVLNLKLCLVECDSVFDFLIPDLKLDNAVSSQLSFKLLKEVQLGLCPNDTCGANSSIVDVEVYIFKIHRF